MTFVDGITDTMHSQLPIILTKYLPEVVLQEWKGKEKHWEKANPKWHMLNWAAKGLYSMIVWLKALNLKLINLSQKIWKKTKTTELLLAAYDLDVWVTLEFSNTDI